MPRISSKTRWVHTAAGLLIVGAVAGRLLAAQLPGSVLQAEAGLVGAGFVYAAAAIALRYSPVGQNPAAQLLMSAGGISLATAVLAVAGPWLPDLVPLSVAITCSFVLTIDPMQSRRFMFAVLAMASVCLAVLWGEALVVLHRTPIEIAVYAMFLAAIVVLVAVTLRLVTDQLQIEIRRTEAIANAAQRVGLATDLGEVARAVLEASCTSYPAADQGGVLLYDASADALIALPVVLLDGVVGTTSKPEIRIKPGQALAGKVFVDGVAQCWETIDAVLAEYSGTSQVTRDKIQELVGVVKSGVVAPLQAPDRGVIGVLTLGSTRSEHVWRPRDLIVVQGLAEQAALGVERARLYQEQRTQALTDHLTGLANNRQLRATLTQEVARAIRNGTSLAILFCDLDDFKEVNDVHGHAIGDRTLKLFAETLVETLRSEDVAARYGGDEFVCVLPGADRDQAMLVASRLGKSFADRLANSPLMVGVKTAVATGVAIFPVDGDSPEGLLEVADANLMITKAGTGVTVQAG
jgi:diguanylate cyclase (GGDEF)-like protein